MEVPTSAVKSNGVQQDTTLSNNYMEFFRELSPKDAKLLKKRVQIDNDLHHYISRVLNSVQGGKEVSVPADFPMQPKPLKAAIKKVARALGIDIRFDASVEGGFIVRAATVQEKELGEAQGKRLSGIPKKKKKA
jgi:hypothetical protein